MTRRRHELIQSLNGSAPQPPGGESALLDDHIVDRKAGPLGTTAALTIPPVDGYVIGDPGRAAAEVGAGIPAGVVNRPDIAVDAARIAGLEVRAASVRGVVHRRFGTPRQDAYSISWRPDEGALVVTVCDGLGAFDRSHEAADLAASRLPDLLDGDWQRAFEALSVGIADRSSVTGAPMATTVVCARITETADGAHRAEVAWVGDSAAYLLGPQGWQCIGGAVKTIRGDGSPLSSATAALPAKCFQIANATVEFGKEATLFLMTDGVADPLGAGAGQVGHTLGQWWADPPNEFEFAAQVGFARRSFDDDRTAVGIWPCPQADDR